MPNAPGNIPRSSNQVGKMFTVGEPGDDLASWLDYTDYFGIGYATPPQVQFGANLAKPGYMLRPPYRTVVFLNLVSAGYSDVFDIDTQTANIAAINNVMVALKETDLSIAFGDANQFVPEGAFGNAYFPDGWPKNDDPANEVLTPNYNYFSAWVWALTLGLPGKPELVKGIDLLVFLVAWTDFGFASPFFVPDTDWSLTSYHDAWFYIQSVEELQYKPDQPTPKFTAHYNRFVSLVPKLARYRAVVLRPTDFPYATFGTPPNLEAEAHLTTHFHNAIYDYVSLGPSLNSFGVELIEYTGSIDSMTITNIIKEHYGLL